MQDTRNKSDYYSYQDAARLLEISYAHLTRCIEFGVFHPVRLGKGAKKYIPKSEVDVKIGQVLYDFRKPRSVQEPLQQRTWPKNQKFTYLTSIPFVIESDVPLSDEDLEAIQENVAKIEDKYGT